MIKLLCLCALLVCADGSSAAVPPGVVLTDRARAQEKAGDISAAELTYREALPLLAPPLGPRDPKAGMVLHRLALICEAQGRFDEAVDLHERALAVRRETLGSYHPDVADSLSGLAATLYYQGKYEKAEALATQAVAVRQKQLPPNAEALATGLNNLAAAQASLGRLATAKKNFLRAVVIRLGNRGEQDRWVLPTLTQFVEMRPDALEATAKEQQALSALDRGLSAQPISTPQVALSIGNLAEVYKAAGRYAEALALHTPAVAYWERSGDQLAIARALRKRAQVYAAHGDLPAAERDLKRALAIRDRVHVSEHPKVAQYLRAMGELHLAQGRADRAGPLFERASRLQTKLAADPRLPDERPVSENLTFTYERIVRTPQEPPAVR